MIWLLIAFAAITAFICRLLPFLMKNSRLLNNQNDSFYRFLNYSTQAMLGVIIYDTAFHQMPLLKLITHFDWLASLRLLLLILIFILVVKTKNMLISFFFGLIVYLIALVVGVP